jgi:hypothetical protein
VTVALKHALIRALEKAAETELSFEDIESIFDPDPRTGPANGTMTRALDLKQGNLLEPREC